MTTQVARRMNTPTKVMRHHSRFASVALALRAAWRELTRVHHPDVCITREALVDMSIADIRRMLGVAR